MSLRGIYDCGGVRKQNGHYQSSKSEIGDKVFASGVYAESIYNADTERYQGNYLIGGNYGTAFSELDGWTNKSFVIKAGKSETLGFKLETKTSKNGSVIKPSVIQYGAEQPWYTRFGAFSLSLTNSFSGSRFKTSKYAWSTSRSSFKPLELVNQPFSGGKYRMLPANTVGYAYKTFFLGDGNNPLQYLYLWEMASNCELSYRNSADIPRAVKYAGIRMKLSYGERYYTNYINYSTNIREFDYTYQKEGPSACSLSQTDRYPVHDPSYWNGYIEYKLENTTNNNITLYLGDFYFSTNTTIVISPNARYKSYYSIYLKKKTSTKHKK